MGDCGRPARSFLGQAIDCGHFFEAVVKVDPADGAADGRTTPACGPRCKVIVDEALGGKSGHRILLDALDPDLTDEECAASVERFRAATRQGPGPCSLNAF